MRGVLTGVLVLLVLACTPARKPPELAPNDPNALDPSDPSKLAKADDQSPPEKPAATAKSTAPAEGDTPPSKKSDDGPHVPDSLGGPAYDRAALEVVLNRASRQVKGHCGAATDENGAVNGPWGKTRITVKLGHNGHSKGGTLPAPYEGKPTGNCVVKAFTNLIYAPFAGDDVDVDWPVEFSKP